MVFDTQFLPGTCIFLYPTLRNIEFIPHPYIEFLDHLGAAEPFENLRVGPLFGKIYICTVFHTNLRVHRPFRGHHIIPKVTSPCIKYLLSASYDLGGKEKRMKM